MGKALRSEDIEKKDIKKGRYWDGKALRRENMEKGIYCEISLPNVSRPDSGSSGSGKRSPHEV